MSDAEGHKLLSEQNLIPDRQAIYHGFVKAKEARALRNAALAKAYFGGSTAGKLTTAKATGAAPATKGEPMSGVSAPVIGFAEKT
jgi:hypothetical protein